MRDLKYQCRSAPKKRFSSISAIFQLSPYVFSLLSAVQVTRPKGKDVICLPNLSSRSWAPSLMVAANRVTEPTFQYYKSCRADWVSVCTTLIATAGMKLWWFTIKWHNMNPKAAARYHLSRDIEFTLRNFRPTHLELLYTPAQLV
jgi:hypothetical protein